MFASKDLTRGSTVPRLLRPTPPRKPGRRARRPFLRLEELEARHLLSGTTWPGLLQPQAEVEGNDTLDQAQVSGPLGVNGRAEVVGAVGNGRRPARPTWTSTSSPWINRPTLT